MKKRSYGQNCALAHTSDIIGERWTLLIVRDLWVRPRRYNELLRSLKGMGTNLLASRLRQLEVDGIVELRTQDHGKPAYQLTQRGRELEPALLGLIRWGFTLKNKNHAKYHHQDDWDILAMKAAFTPANAPKSSVSVQFDTTEPFWVAIKMRKFNYGFGTLNKPDVAIHGSIAQLHQHPRTTPMAGDKEKLEGFLAAFRLE